MSVQKLIAEAERLLEKGKVDEGIAKLKQALDQEPLNQIIATKLAATYLQEDKTAEAVKVFDSLGRRLSDAGKSHLAIAIYKQAVDLAPQDISLRVRFAQECESAGKLADAFLQAQVALDYYLRRKKYFDAATLMPTLVRAQAKNEKIKMAWIEVMEYCQAEQKLIHLLVAFCGPPGLASPEFQVGGEPTALTAALYEGLKRLVPFFPRDPRVAYSVAWTAYRRGRMRDFYLYLQECYRREPDFGLATLLFARVLAEEKKLNEALFVYQYFKDHLPTDKSADQLTLNRLLESFIEKNGWVNFAEDSGEALDAAGFLAALSGQKAAAEAAPKPEARGAERPGAPTAAPAKPEALELPPAEIELGGVPAAESNFEIMLSTGRAVAPKPPVADAPAAAPAPEAEVPPPAPPRRKSGTPVIPREVLLGETTPDDVPASAREEVRTEMFSPMEVLDAANVMQKRQFDDVSTRMVEVPPAEKPPAAPPAAKAPEAPAPTPAPAPAPERAPPVFTPAPEISLAASDAEPTQFTPRPSIPMPTAPAKAAAPTPPPSETDQASLLIMASEASVIEAALLKNAPAESTVNGVTLAQPEPPAAPAAVPPATPPAEAAAAAAFAEAPTRIFQAPPPSAPASAESAPPPADAEEPDGTRVAPLTPAAAPAETPPPEAPAAALPEAPPEAPAPETPAAPMPESAGFVPIPTLTPIPAEVVAAPEAAPVAPAAATTEAVDLGDDLLEGPTRIFVQPKLSDHTEHLIQEIQQEVKDKDADGVSAEMLLRKAERFVAKRNYYLARKALRHAQHLGADEGLVKERLREIRKLEFPEALYNTISSDRPEKVDTSALLDRLEEEFDLAPDEGWESGELSALVAERLGEIFRESDPRTILDFGVGLHEMGLFRQAEEVFIHLVENFPSYAFDAYYLAANAKLSRRDYAGAASILKWLSDDSARSESEKIQIYYALGETFEKMQQPERSREFFEKVAELDANYRNIRHKLEE